MRLSSQKKKDETLEIVRINHKCCNDMMITIN